MAKHAPLKLYLVANPILDPVAVAEGIAHAAFGTFALWRQDPVMREWATGSGVKVIVAPPFEAWNRLCDAAHVYDPGRRRDVRGQATLDDSKLAALFRVMWRSSIPRPAVIGIHPQFSGNAEAFPGLTKWPRWGAQHRQVKQAKPQPGPIINI